MVKTTLNKKNARGIHKKHGKPSGYTVHDPQNASESDMKSMSCLEQHTLASSAGSFKDDPFWESMISSIEDTRRELDAEYSKPE